MKLDHTTVLFSRGKKKYRFEIVNNLAKFQLSIDTALIHWSERTDAFTDQSLCDYITNKDPLNIICITKAEFDKIKNNQ